MRLYRNDKLARMKNSGHFVCRSVRFGKPRAWMSREQGKGHEFLHEATQMKKIWTPTGE